MHSGFNSNICKEMSVEGKKIFIPLKMAKFKISIQSKHNQSHLLFVLLRETVQVYANFKNSTSMVIQENIIHEAHKNRMLPNRGNHINARLKMFSFKSSWL
jgi:hypothetical protein